MVAKRMIQARILQVMESWPLQLLIQTENEKKTVGLTLDTTILRGGRVVDAGQLRPNVLTRLSLLENPANPAEAVVEAIELLE
jgi:hypothetical protein